MTVFDSTLTTLSPLHIGNGDELKQDFDFCVREGKTYVLDIDATLMAKEDQLKNPDGSYKLPCQLLQTKEECWQYSRYVLAGTPRSSKTDARVKSFIKDYKDRPYVPGSSLKGALRTALAWHGWNEVKPDVDRNSFGRSRSWAAQKIDRRIFGRNPNFDFLRTLQVSDLFGLDEPGSGLALVNAKVLTKRSTGSPIELEALRGDLSFKGTIKIDDSLFSLQSEKKLQFSSRKHWLDELTARVQSHSRSRIEKLADWFESCDSEMGAEGVARFYRQLYDARLNENQALIQLGWGTGWDGKTYWSHLQEDKYLFEKLVADFRLHRQQRNSPPRKPGDAFPRSKRAVMSTKVPKSKPLAPFGWVLFEMKERL